MISLVEKKYTIHGLISSLVALIVVVACIASAVAADKSSERLGWKMTYDDANRIQQVVDPAGRETKFQYTVDTAKRLRKAVRSSASGEKVTHELDELGRILRMTDGAGPVSYGYDQWNRINRIQRQGGAAIAYGYDTLNRVTRLEVGDFYRIDYVYDFLGRLESMKTPVGEIRYDYLTGQGQVVRTLPNKVKTIWEYEANGQLRRIVHVDAQNVILAEYTYQYRPDGLIAAIGERSGTGQVTKSYEYDQMGRLVKAKGPQSYEYGYDLVGNRLKATATGKPPQIYTYDWIGRITSVNGQQTQHDTAGNLTSLPLNGANLQYRYNQDSQLVEAVNGKVAYRYDGEGRLIARKAAGMESTFIPDPVAPIWRPLVIENNQGPRTLVVWEGGTPTVMIRDGQPEYFLHDHLNSVRMVTDAQGKISQRIDYDAFGAIVNGVNGPILAPRFGGLFWDQDAGAYHSLARAYVPILGRFLQLDPSAKISDVPRSYDHLYSYCGNDPVNWIDPDGNERRPVNPIDDAGTNSIPAGIWFHDKVRNYIDGWLDSYQDKIPTGEKVAIVFLGINNRWDQASDATQKHFEAGKYTIFVPTYEGISLKADWLRTANDYVRTGSPIGMLAFAISPIPIQIHTRKIGVPELLQHLENRFKAEGRGTTVSAIVFESGANFVLQENVTRLVAYARKHSKLPEIAVLSGSISTVAHVTPLENARFKVVNLGEYGEGPGHQDRLVSALQKRTPDFSPGRLPLLGVPGYLINLGKTTFKYAPHGTLLSDNVGSNDISVELAYPIPKKERGHGAFARLDLVDSYLAAISGKRAPPGAATGISSDSMRPGADLPGIDPHRLQQSQKLAEIIMKQIESAREVIKKHDMIGGDGRVAGPGGFASPGAYRALGEFRQTSPISPSPVGGVYLGGSGQSLAGLGLLDGIAQDRNGNLVLISKSGEQLKLPPLRLDDLVTVFRSVYMNGEGPTVTIDPNPENPEGAAMIIKHSKATENTYVGWILYQCDRIMKGYTIGKDNITNKFVTSSVAGFAEMLDKIYFGGEEPGKLRKEGTWERFWIVPAEARRFGAPKNELTLFDVPLKVKTQKMKWQNGELVDDTSGKSSPGALAFINWFSTNYDFVAREQFLTPPRESGITEPVPVFSELRRIALMTSIAEKMRDQGVPMPFWMRDYEVRAVPFEKTTPGLEVTRLNDKKTISARIYGGVGLSPADKDVRNFPPSTDLSKLAKPEAASVRQSLTLAAGLEETVRSQMAAAEPLKVQALTQQGASYQAVALPGADTQALSPARLEEVDLTVPVEGSDPIRLVRSYNSYFSPTGPWGKGWALDLPKLLQVQSPSRRDDKGVVYQRAYELVTPLNTIHARFSKVEAVPAFNRNRLQVPDQPSEFFGLADGKPDFLSAPTLQLIRKDGVVWHFSQAGDLVATEQAGSRVVYERDGKGQLTRIVGILGKRPVSSIELRYNAAGRMESAKATIAKQDVVIRYEYDQAGRLSGIVSDAGRLGYRYENSLVTEVTYRAAGADAKKTSEKSLRRFQYGPRGRLLAEIDANGNKTEYRISTEPNGSAVTVAYGGKESSSDVIRYDRAFRPIAAKSANGSQAAWSYPDGGGVVLDLKEPGGQQIRITQSADQRSRTVESEGNRKLTAQYDTSGRLTSLADTGLTLLRQEWFPDGRPIRTITESSATSLEYDRDGLVSRVLQSPPNEKGQLKQWQATKLDPNGSPREVTDFRGLQVLMDYAGPGVVKSVTTKRDGKQFGFEIGRDQAGRIQEVNSSWGKQRYAYDSSGQLSKLETESAGQRSIAEWKSGLLQKVRQFDGGEFTMAYYEQDKRAGLPKKITTPNQLALAYEYDDANRLSKVDVGAAYRLSLEYDKKGRLAGWAYTPK